MSPGSGGWYREVGKGTARGRRLYPPAMPRATESLAVHVVVFPHMFIKPITKCTAIDAMARGIAGGESLRSLAAPFPTSRDQPPSSRTLLGPRVSPIKRGSEGCGAPQSRPISCAVCVPVHVLSTRDRGCQPRFVLVYEITVKRG